MDITSISHGSGYLHLKAGVARRCVINYHGALITGACILYTMYTCILYIYKLYSVI